MNVLLMSIKELSGIYICKTKNLIQLVTVAKKSVFLHGVSDSYNLFVAVAASHKKRNQGSYLAEAYRIAGWYLVDSVAYECLLTIVPFLIPLVGCNNLTLRPK